MSDPYAASPEIADDEDDRPSAALEREGDAILAGAGAGAETEDQDETEIRPVNSLRQAVREDLADGQLWLSRRGARAREAVQDEPVRATLYALGIGVVIGLILAR